MYIVGFIIRIYHDGRSLERGKKKPDTIIRDNEEKNSSVNRHCNFRGWETDQKKKPIVSDSKEHSRNTAYTERKNKRDNSKNRGKWNNVRIIQKLPDQHIE